MANQADNQGPSEMQESGQCLSFSLSQATLNNIVIAGRYEVVRLLGEGGMSLVYLIRHTELGKLMALKILRPIAIEDVVRVKRFKREAQSASLLDHPNITKIYDYGVEDGYPFIVMDYLEGMSLASVIEKDGALPVRWAIGILLQICDAFEYMHQQGVIHRDLKPSNIMLTEGHSGPNYVKIFDFGIARLLPQGQMQFETLTLVGEVFGSPLYMSPEQCRGQRADARSDVYSMGVVMYEMFTGCPPFADENPQVVIRRQLTEEPPKLTRAVVDVGQRHALENIIFKAMAKEPDKRYPSMGKLKADLELVGREPKQSLWNKFVNSWSRT